MKWFQDVTKLIKNLKDIQLGDVLEQLLQE